MSRLSDGAVSISFGDRLDDCSRREQDDDDQYDHHGFPVQKHKSRIHAVRLFLEKAITSFIP
jgi:hypothetical protein